MTMKQLGEELGVAESTISQYETGKRQPDNDTLLLDGEFLCKQVCQDFVGNLHLFALNRARKDADQTIWHDTDRSLTCFGTILMERVALPSDV